MVLGDALAADDPVGRAHDAAVGEVLQLASLLNAVRVKTGADDLNRWSRGCGRRRYSCRRGRRCCGCCCGCGEASSEPIFAVT